jgi:hypothetical protein
VWRNEWTGGAAPPRTKSRRPPSPSTVSFRAQRPISKFFRFLSKIPRGVYPERQSEILRFAQNDSEWAPPPCWFACRLMSLMSDGSCTDLAFAARMRP